MVQPRREAASREAAARVEVERVAAVRAEARRMMVVADMASSPVVTL